MLLTIVEIVLHETVFDINPHLWATAVRKNNPRCHHRSGPTLVTPALTTVKQQATVSRVQIRNFVHKGLKRLYAEDIEKGVPPATVDKLRKMLAFLDDMQDAEELRNLPAWNVHTLTGDRKGRKGTWSLSLTRNQRLTFRVEAIEHEIYDLTLEDYH